MSGYEIPFHIQEEIMKRLPVKSLIQFRSVSKTWKCLIDSHEFIAAHSLYRHTQQHHLFVSYEDPVDKGNYVCFVDDDTFPQQMSVPTLPLSIKRLHRPRIVGSSHGLLCVYGHFNFTTKMAVIWNPSIRKSIDVAVPKQSYIGFGVCPVTSDPKIIAIIQSRDLKLCIVHVYTLSSGKWKRLSNNLDTKRFQLASSPVVTDRFIYWVDVLARTTNRIMSFDVTTESFEVIDLPDSLALKDRGNLYISKLRGSLAMLQHRCNIRSVWTMEHGVQRSFTKLFTINIQVGRSIVGFRKSGVPMAIRYVNHDGVDYDEQPKLVFYEPNSDQSNDVEIPGSPCSFDMNSYMETLLLLSRSDSTCY